MKHEPRQMLAGWGFGGNCKADSLLPTLFPLSALIDSIVIDSTSEAGVSYQLIDNKFRATRRRFSVVAPFQYRYHVGSDFQELAH